jgi:hypothetical protein
MPYDRLMEVFQAPQLRYFFYNDGGDSTDTCLKVAQVSAHLGYHIIAVHVPTSRCKRGDVSSGSNTAWCMVRWRCSTYRDALLDIRVSSGCPFTVTEAATDTVP